MLKSPCTRGLVFGRKRSFGKVFLKFWSQNISWSTFCKHLPFWLWWFFFQHSATTFQLLWLFFISTLSMVTKVVSCKCRFDGMFSFFIFYFMHHFCPHSLLRLCKEKMQHWFWITTPPANKHRLWKTHETLTLLMFSFVFEGTSLGRTFTHPERCLLNLYCPLGGYLVPPIWPTLYRWKEDNICQTI